MRRFIRSVMSASMWIFIVFTPILGYFAAIKYLFADDVAIHNFFKMLPLTLAVLLALMDCFFDNGAKH